MYIFKCYCCHREINLWNGDAYKTEIVRINGHWQEVQIHMSPTCETRKHNFYLIRGGRNASHS